MVTIKKCEHCGKPFVLKNMTKWGKSRPGNYKVKEDYLGIENYYHKNCWELLEKAEVRKNKLTLALNSSGPSISYEHKF